MKYRVRFTDFAERYFIKGFSKKYKGSWDRTRDVLEKEFAFVDVLFPKNIAEIISISQDGNIKICKTEFAIIGTNKSRRTSGNRCIIAIHEDTAAVYVLLVYHKSDIAGSNETSWWKRMVKDNYAEYGDFLN
jgi:hypothetical protein